MNADQYYSFENLWQQYRACRRNKRNTLNALEFELDAQANLLELREELITHTYRPGRSICFISNGPKPREVFAARFRDRVVHHLLVSRQEPIFERRFIHDSYACRQGKGTLAASDALMRMLRSRTCNGRRAAWALSLDIASFFPSIVKSILYRSLVRAVRDPEVAWLTRVVLFHDPTRDYVFRPRDPGTAGPEAGEYPVPERKSLFGKQGERGLPIGNLTSQFWGNVYLDALDQFVKRELKCRHYVRYVDDFVLLSERREQLIEWRERIERFVHERLQLELRPGRDEIRNVAQGIDFVGWNTFWSHRLVRRRTLGNLRAAAARFARDHVRVVKADDSGGEVLSVRPRISKRRRTHAGGRGAASESPMAQLRCSLASYAGHLRHGASRRVWGRLWSEFGWMSALFCEKDAWRATPRWVFEAPPIPYASRDRNYRDVIRWAGNDCLVFWPTGRFIEFRGPQRLLAERYLGLRRARIARGGYAFTCGFPARLAPQFRDRALRCGLSVVIVGRIGPSDAGRGTIVARVVLARGESANWTSNWTSSQSPIL